MATIRRKIAAVNADTTTPDTRLADDPLRLNPCTVKNLIHLMLGGMHPRHEGAPLHCRLRYFDPLRRRAGVPEGVAALVERMSADEVTLTLVNVNQLQPREVVLQAGGYGEHEFVSLQGDGAGGEEEQAAAAVRPVNAPTLSVRLAPGCGGRVTLKMRRYVNQPTFAQPWDR